MTEWYRWIHRFLRNQKTNIGDHSSNQDIVNSNSNLQTIHVIINGGWHQDKFNSTKHSWYWRLNARLAFSFRFPFHLCSSILLWNLRSSTKRVRIKVFRSRGYQCKIKSEKENIWNAKGINMSYISAYLQHIKLHYCYFLTRFLRAKMSMLQPGAPIVI